MIKDKSVFCTKDKCIYYALFHLAKSSPVWYFIVRKGDTNVQVNQNPIGNGKFPKVISGQLIQQQRIANAKEGKQSTIGQSDSI
jgi:hypothetical protein